MFSWLIGFGEPCSKDDMASLFSKPNNMETKKIIIPTLHNKIAHLTLKERQNLYKRFYNEPNNALIKEFKIKQNANLHELFEPRLLKDLKCPFCNTNMWQDYPPKKYGTSYDMPGYCPACGHKKSLKENQDTIFCTCNTCMAERKRQAEDEQKRREEEKRLKIQEQIEEIKNQNKPSIYLEDLSLTNMIYFYAFLKSKEEYHSELGSFNNYKPHSYLAPTNDLKEKIIHELLTSGAINLDENIDPEQYLFYKDSKKIDYLFNGDYLVSNVRDDEQVLAILENEINKNGMSYFNELLALWKRIALHETIQYLNHQLAYVNFPLRKGKKTVEILTFFLDYYSTLQLCRNIDRCIESSAKEVQAGSIMPNYAANRVINGLKNYSQHGVDQDWYRSGKMVDYRNYYSQSIISLSFFKEILRLDEMGLKSNPSEENLEEHLKSLNESQVFRSKIIDAYLTEFVENDEDNPQATNSRQKDENNKENISGKDIDNITAIDDYPDVPF